MKFHPDVLAAHAQFGGDLEDMQRQYDTPTQPTATTTEVSEAMVERIAAALENAEVGYSMSLIRLVDGISTYRLEYSDGETLEFDSSGAVYEHIAQKKRRTQARAALEAALSTAPSGDGVPPDAMVQCGWAYQDARWDADRWHVCGFENKPREHEGRLVRPIYVPAGDGVPGMVLDTGCASEGCGKQATIRFERGGVGSYYCHDCYMRIQAIPASQRGTE